MMKKMQRRQIWAAVISGILLLNSGLSTAAAPSVTNEISQRELEHAALSQKAAMEGMVLLENKNQVLPIVGSGNIALFGGGAVNTIKGGTGSGDVNQRDTVTVWEGFKTAGYYITSASWLNAYCEAYEKGRAEFQGIWWDEYTMADPELTKEDLEKAKADHTDTAVYVIARNSGEGEDRTAAKGDYYLTETEEKNLKKLAKNFEKVIVVLNVGGVIDTQFFNDIEGLDALLLMSQAGMEGGSALVNILNGTVTPSGKLTDTWPANYEDYPNADSFGENDGNVAQEDYTEGIYVGYRYFDTFDVEPAYEFGYGKSYTDFEIITEETAIEEDMIAVTVTVKNTGDKYTGKEVAEVYFSAPDGELEKPYQELGAFGKTDELAPGASQSMTITFPITEMSSYSEERAAYILEAGDYLIRVGSSSRNTRIEAVIHLEQTVITEQLSNQMKVDHDLETLSKKNVAPYSYEGEDEEIEKAVRLELDTEQLQTAMHASSLDDEQVTAYVSDTTEQEYLAENLDCTLHNKYHGDYEEIVQYLPGDFSQSTLKDVYDGTITIEEFVSGLTVSQMADLVIGGSKLPVASGQSAGASSENLMYASNSAVSEAQKYSVRGAAGETAGIYIEEKMIPNIILADGPAGLRLSQEYQETNGQTYYQFCTAWPIGTLLASTWNVDLVEEVGTAFGKELLEYGVTILLAPGMNIHRNALCGRNFEYFSEDPWLTGMMGIAETVGIQSNEGIGVCIKHFAANNQESNRTAQNSTIDERTLREIYLKPFELTVKGAQPMSIMSSYNMVNGVPAGDSYDLLTDIPRGEWGFAGMIMSDWGGGRSTPSISLHAGNDLIMPGSDVEDITVRGFQDEEPVFDEDDLYPKVTITEGWSSRRADTNWGEFVLDPDGDVQIVKTVSNEWFQTAERSNVDENGNEIKVKVSKLISDLGNAVKVIQNENETTTVIYQGYYEENNIALGDLQKSTIQILKIILQSNQFADMFSDVEAVKYTENLQDILISYGTVIKSEIHS